jgi:hypothetical protein
MAGWINRNFHFEKEELTCVMEILIRLDGVRTMSIPPMLAAVTDVDVWTSALELVLY